MKLSDHLDDYTSKADAYLARHNSIRLQITTGRDAWHVAHCAGIVRHAYSVGPDVVDAHIQTALQNIFPNAVFRDRKRY